MGGGVKIMKIIVAIGAGFCDKSGVKTVLNKKTNHSNAHRLADSATVFTHRSSLGGRCASEYLEQGQKACAANVAQSMDYPQWVVRFLTSGGGTEGGQHGRRTHALGITGTGKTRLANRICNHATRRVLACSAWHRRDERPFDVFVVRRSHVCGEHAAQPRRVRDVPRRLILPERAECSRPNVSATS